MGDDWRRIDKETDYPELMARKLLIEFIGGAPGEMLRDQFRDMKAPVVTLIPSRPDLSA
jgi:hypothetical protein